MEVDGRGLFWAVIAKLLGPNSLKRFGHYSWPSWIPAVVWCTGLKTLTDLNLSENHIQLEKKLSESGLEGFFFEKCRLRLRIVGATVMTYSNFHDERLQALGAGAQNVVARATSRRRFLHPWF